MTFYKKKGRLSTEEKAIIQSIERFIEKKSIPLDEIPNCENLDDLLEVLNLVESYSINEVNNENSSEGESIEIQEQEQQLESEIEETSEEVIEPIENEEMTLQSNEVPNFVAEDYNPFSEEIIERSYNKAQEEQTIKEELPLAEDENLELKEVSSTPVDDANSRTKQKVAEQTADAILKGYSRIAPMPFKWLAKIDEEKVEKLSIDGQIEISLEVDEGTTFDEYVQQTNAQVDELFEVEEETLQEIREPLIEVLMEQEMELTPQQRLTMAVVSHLFQMLTVALKLRKQNNRILQYQKEMTRLSNVKVA